MSEYRTLPVRHHFTEADLDAFADRAAHAVRKVADLEDEKRETAKEFKTRIDALHSEIRDLSRRRREGFEMVPTSCRLRRDHGTQMRQWVDEATGEVVLEEPFNNDDRQRGIFEED